jgi:hypothetical protein
MEFPSSQADSPTTLRGIAGPSRARLEARQQRNSTSKPYDRNGSTVATPVVTPQRSRVGLRSRNDSIKSTYSSKSYKSKAGSEVGKISGGGGGLLSGLREAIFSRPLSWFAGGSAKAQNASSGLPSHQQQTAAQRLAASVRSKEGDDIESHQDSVAGKQKSIAPPPISTSKHPLALQSSSLSMSARSPSPARSSASAVIQSHGRQRLSGGPTPQSPRYTGSVISTPGYRRNGSLHPEGSTSLNGVVASQSSPSYAFGFGSERRLAGLSSAASATTFLPPSPLASSSYSKLPSKSPFAMNRHSVTGSSVTGSVMGIEKSPRFGGSHLGTPSRSRPTSLFGGEMNRSRAGSVADSRASNASHTPRRRDWSTLKLAPPRVQLSEGEELMQAYMAIRDGVNSSQGLLSHPALQSSSDSLMMEFGAGPSFTPPQLAGHSHHEGSLKRGVSMSLDGDESMGETTPRKKQKQMVWDQELGFISKHDLRARRECFQTPSGTLSFHDKLIHCLLSFFHTSQKHLEPCQRMRQSGF